MLPSYQATFSFAILVWLATHSLAQDPNLTLSYPTSKVVSQVDDYHGTKVDDPFRWLEDVDAQDTKTWVSEQNRLTFDYLASIPARERFKDRLTKLWNFERYGLPRQHGKTYFYTYDNGLQNQYLAYGVAQSGSDWNEWRIRDVQTGDDLADSIRWVKFSSVAWTADHLGFFYSRYDAPKENEFTGVNYFQKLYYHRVGTDQQSDLLVYERPDEKEWGFGGSVSDDGKYIAVAAEKDTLQIWELTGG